MSVNVWRLARRFRMLCEWFVCKKIFRYTVSDYSDLLRWILGHMQLELGNCEAECFSCDPLHAPQTEEEIPSPLCLAHFVVVIVLMLCVLLF